MMTKMGDTTTACRMYQTHVTHTLLEKQSNTNPSNDLQKKLALCKVNHYLTIIIRAVEYSYRVEGALCQTDITCILMQREQTQTSAMIYRKDLHYVK